MLKKLIPLFIFPLTLSALIAQDGIRFASGAWQEILERAEAEDKIIFVDAYTTWCGPCKMMSAQVFPEKAVGDLYNEHFINVKIDMEKGEGLRLASQYRVEAYPSLLFVDGQGEIVHRAVGFHNVPEFIELGRTALDPGARLSAYRERYQSGNRDPEFLHDYAMVSYRAMDGNLGRIAEDYLQTQEDWSTEKNRRFIFTFVDDVDSELFQYIAAHRESFEELFGSQAVISRIQNLIMQEAFSGESGPQSLEKVDELFQQVYPEVAGQLSALFRMNYFQYTGDSRQYAEATIDYFRAYPPDNPTELNNAAWNFFELVEDPDQLKEAVKWAEESVAMQPAYYNYDTLASLYFKLGNKKKARKAAEKAIELAKESGDDYAATQELLELIKAL